MAGNSMEGDRQTNLKRLFAPRHIAVIGGDVAASAARLSRAEGFAGEIWAVNPKGRKMGGAEVFHSIDELPEAPDASFIAVPRDAAIASLSALRRRGAGAAVLYTAGFRELGAEGAKAEERLIEAAGNMAVVGPNCFGMLNYIQGALLWPYDHGAGRVEKGVAIVSQSGMLTSNMTMGRRHLPFAYMISSGNQSVLGVEDYLTALVDDPAVTGIGLYLEGLNDVQAFAEAAGKALAAAKPIVAMKAGRSSIAASLTVSHTGSLSGDDALYQALFDRLGIIRVDSPTAMMESLKALTIAGPLAGRRLAAFTGSGGDAAVLADEAQRWGLAFPQPTERTRKAMAGLLPEIATHSNPLDYTTALWGSGDPLAEVMEAQLSDGFDAALVVQDYPKPPLTDDLHLYQADSDAFIKATLADGVPGVIISSIPENHLDGPADKMREAGVAPLQGIDEGMAALARAADYGEALRRARPGALYPTSPLPDEARRWNEWEAKRQLAAAGLQVPRGQMVPLEQITQAAEEIGYPVALKAVSVELIHKTEAGAVILGLRDGKALVAAAKAMAHDLEPIRPEGFLIEAMAPAPLAEILVSIRRDPHFGLVLVLASGGILVDLLGDSATLLLPASDERILAALASLKVSRLIEGYRGTSVGDKGALLAAIRALETYALDQGPRFVELEINPLFIYADGVIALDVLLSQG